MSHPIFGETLQSNGCRVFYTNQTITIMTDRIHGYYTLDTLRMLNPLYDYEHRMTEQDVDAVNALRAHIRTVTGISIRMRFWPHARSMGAIGSVWYHSFPLPGRCGTVCSAMPAAARG